MSASIVPSLYDAIVEEVVNQSRQDFQEDGITEATLQEFKSRWTQKIAATGATTLPGAKADTREDVKAEDAHGAIDAMPSVFPQGGNALAAMRAAQQIQQLQARSNGGIQQQQQQHQADTAVAHLMEEARQAQQANGGATKPAAAASASTHTFIKPEPEVHDALPPAPSSQASTTNGKKRSLSIKSESDRAPSRMKKAKPPRLDIDLDDEAINSDLDDSDDDALRADGDDVEDGDVQTVLCLFDKVQRTKNKWKCVLKDGIVNVNGRDFAFTKANGEFEW